jgi:hypothetical protein
MPTIIIETIIKTDKQIVFDLSRSIDLHKISTKETNEEAIAGVTSGLTHKFRHPPRFVLISFYVVPKILITLRRNSNLHLWRRALFKWNIDLGRSSVRVIEKVCHLFCR